MIKVLKIVKPNEQERMLGGQIKHLFLDDVEVRGVVSIETRIEAGALKTATITVFFDDLVVEDSK